MHSWQTGCGSDENSELQLPTPKLCFGSWRLGLGVDMLTISDLPALNATLNGLAAILLISGYLFIKRGNQRKHQWCMLGALGTSALFLVSYVTYHLNTGSRPFPGQGPIRLVYFTILITHVVLAAVIVPLALITATRGLQVAIRPPRQDCTLDLPRVGLCICHRRRDLLDALPALLTAR